MTEPEPEQNSRTSNKKEDGSNKEYKVNVLESIGVHGVIGGTCSVDIVL